MVGVTLANVLPASFSSHPPPPAAGLYYLAELIEEYTVATSRIIKYMIWVSGSFPQDFPLFCPASKEEVGRVWQQMRPLSLLFPQGATPTSFTCTLSPESALWVQVFPCLLPQVAALHCRPCSQFPRVTAECTLGVGRTMAWPLLRFFPLSLAPCSVHSI